MTAPAQKNGVVRIRPWRHLAHILATAPGPTVDRAGLRAAMHDFGRRSISRTSSNKLLRKALREWEGYGWIRRGPGELITVLDRSALREAANAESHSDMRLTRRLDDDSAEVQA